MVVPQKPAPAWPAQRLRPKSRLAGNQNRPFHPGIGCRDEGHGEHHNHRAKRRHVTLWLSDVASRITKIAIKIVAVKGFFITPERVPP